jgi:hypothetical protein
MTYETSLLRLAEKFNNFEVRRVSWVTERLGALSMEAEIPPYSSDRAAWAETVGMPGSPADALFPASVMKYSIVMGSGWFINWQPAGPAGLGVCIEVNVGSQWIFISYPTRASDAGKFEERTGEFEGNCLADILLVAGSKMYATSSPCHGFRIIPLSVFSPQMYAMQFTARKTASLSGHIFWQCQCSSKPCLATFATV